jgi:hypothetical protein
LGLAWLRSAESLTSRPGVAPSNPATTAHFVVPTGYLKKIKYKQVTAQSSLRPYKGIVYAKSAVIGSCCQAELTLPLRSLRISVIFKIS